MLAHAGAHSGLQPRDRAGRCQGRVGGALLSRCGLPAEGQPSEQHSGHRNAGRPRCAVAPPPPTWRLRVAPSLGSMSLASTAPTAVLSHPDTPHPAFTASLSHFQRLFHTSGLPQLQPRIFLKSLKGLQTPDKRGLATACPSSLLSGSKCNQHPVSTCIARVAPSLA